LIPVSEEGRDSNLIEDVSGVEEVPFSASSPVDVEEFLHEFKKQSENPIKKSIRPEESFLYNMSGLKYTRILLGVS
jgi:hypothetical protein